MNPVGRSVGRSFMDQLSSKKHSNIVGRSVGLVGRLVKSVRAACGIPMMGLLSGRRGSVPGDFLVGRRSFYHKYIISTRAQTVSWVYWSGQYYIMCISA